MEEKNPHLLEIIKWEEDKFKTSGRRLMIEGIPVSPETHPYLVSGMARKVLWIRQPREHLSVAFRYMEALEDLYTYVVEAVSKEGVKNNWGNVTSFSEEGIEEGIKYLLYYGISPADILYSENGPPLTEKTVIVSEENPEISNHVYGVSWLPPGYAVVVPENRAYLGSAIVISDVYTALVIHNASRGLVVLKEERDTF